LAGHALIVQRPARQGVVDVPAPRRIHGTHPETAKVLPVRLSLQVRVFVERPRQRRNARVHRGGEGSIVDVSLEEHRGRLGVGVAQLTE